MSDIPMNLGTVSETRKWLGFAGLCIAMFMAVLDIQIVITSLSVIEEALGIGADRMSWIQTSYLIAEIITIPLTGLLMRVLSLKRLVLIAITVFTAASIGCALSTSFAQLVTFRTFQGMGAGILIPTMFSAVFLLFRPGQEQALATVMGGILAVIAPTMGPVTGGLITETLSWHWLFLINVAPCFIAAVLVFACFPREPIKLGLLKQLDVASLIFLAVSLAALEIGLKEAPDQGWLSPLSLALFGTFAGLTWLMVIRPAPVVDFSLLKDRYLAYGCGLSFILGIGLIGSVYLLPVFLALVGYMGPLEIGIIILVTGIAQLVSAPLSVVLDRLLPPRLLAMIGFGVFAAGLAMSGFETSESGYDELFWAQVVRGLALGFCIVPVTRFALGFLPVEKVSDASGLYNLSRALGGVIGIALIDTLLFTRSAEHADRITSMMTADPAAAASLLRITPDELPDPEDPTGLLGIMDTVQETAVTLAVNEAWLMMGALTALALILLWRLGPIREEPGAGMN
ncbi:DHA2 family efflux MFS transporter permease subunit [Aestuariivirga sp.]|jgi:DHA2 family multidrug resistance protein|uniref:DHA2 family efflux MFS transporter permease subunit n=1 Tax=Aestuariivirga sp. TaxID=2650926 RepID=UPI00378491C8